MFNFTTVVFHGTSPTFYYPLLQPRNIQTKINKFQVHYTDEKNPINIYSYAKSAVINRNIRLCVLEIIREAPKGHAVATLQQVGWTGRGHLSCFDFLTTQRATVFQYGEIAHARCYKISSFLSDVVTFPTDLTSYVRFIRSAFRIPSRLQARRSRRQHFERTVHK